jgi:hypothetical protein
VEAKKETFFLSQPFKAGFCCESSYLPKNRTRLQYNDNVFNECLRENADPAELKATT